MKRFAGVLAVAMATGTMLVSAAGPAQAAPVATRATVTAPEIQWTGPVAVSRDDDTVVVKGRYRCTAPLDEMHLWVSVKQGARTRRPPAAARRSTLGTTPTSLRTSR